MNLVQLIEKIQSTGGRVESYHVASGLDADFAGIDLSALFRDGEVIYMSSSGTGVETDFEDFVESVAAIGDLRRQHMQIEEEARRALGRASVAEIAKLGSVRNDK